MFYIRCYVALINMNLLTKLKLCYNLLVAKDKPKERGLEIKMHNFIYPKEKRKICSRPRCDREKARYHDHLCNSCHDLMTGLS